MAIVSVPPRQNLRTTHPLQSIGPRNLRCPRRLWRPKRKPDIPSAMMATTRYSQLLQQPMKRASTLHRLKLTAPLIVTTSQSPAGSSREVACERGQQRLRSITILSWFKYEGSRDESKHLLAVYACCKIMLFDTCRLTMCPDSTISPIATIALGPQTS